MTKIYLYTSDPAAVLAGDLNFALESRTDAPKQYAEYADGIYIDSVEVDLDKHLERLQINAVNVLKSEIARTRAESEIRCQKLEGQLQTYLAIDHKPSLEVVV
jgi:hypothetical protein